MNDRLNILLAVDNISKNFPIKSERGPDRILKAVDGISFNVAPGEVIGIVGESGCGKSTLGKTIIRIYEPDDGHLQWKGEDLTQFKGEQLKKIRKNMQMIFQDPYSSLNPRKKIRDISASRCACTGYVLQMKSRKEPMQ